MTPREVLGTRPWEWGPKSKKAQEKRKVLACLPEGAYGSVYVLDGSPILFVHKLTKFDGGYALEALEMPATLDGLSDRDRETLMAVGEGSTTAKQIAAHFGISNSGAHARLRRICKKLACCPIQMVSIGESYHAAIVDGFL